MINMNISRLLKRYKLRIVLQFVLFLVSQLLYGQTTDYKTLLDTKPYFADHDVKPADSLFLRDVEILKHLGDFSEADQQLLKGNVLKEILAVQIDKGQPATYRTIIDFMTDYKRTPAYADFVAGVLLYKEMEHKTVNPKNWETDKDLFIKLGFTASDLDDFREFIAKPANVKLTYKEAYIQYMQEIEAMTAPVPVKRD